MAGGGRFKAAADFGASEFKDLLAAGRDNVEATVFFPGAVVLVFPTSFRAADAETKGLTGCCVAVRLVLVTAVVVVVVVLPVVVAAAGRGAEFTVDLLVLGAAVALAVAEVLGLAAGAVAGLGAVDLGLVAALVAAVAGLLLRPEAVPTPAPVFVPAAVVVVVDVVVVDLLVPAVVTLGWGLEVATAVEEPRGFLLRPEAPLVVVGFFLSPAALVAGMGFLVRVLAEVFVRPLFANRFWVALGLVPGPVVAGAAAVVLPLIGPLDLLLASTAFPEVSFTFGGATCSFWGSSGCGGDCVVPF